MLCGAAERPACTTGAPPSLLLNALAQSISSAAAHIGAEVLRGAAVEARNDDVCVLVCHEVSDVGPVACHALAAAAVGHIELNVVDLGAGGGEGIIGAGGGGGVWTEGEAITKGRGLGRASSSPRGRRQAAGWAATAVPSLHKLYNASVHAAAAAVLTFLGSPFSVALIEEEGQGEERQGGGRCDIDGSSDDGMMRAGALVETDSLPMLPPSIVECAWRSTIETHGSPCPLIELHHVGRRWDAARGLRMSGAARNRQQQGQRRQASAQPRHC